MSIEVITPSSREEWLALRRETLGASEVPVLLGVGQWSTPYALYCLKKGLLPADAEETPAQRRGRLLEDDALTILQEERPDWTVIPNTIPGGKFFRDMTRKMSCTPDAFVAAPGRPHGVAQVKSVQRSVFSRQWKAEDGSIEPPLHVAVQALQDARLTGSEWACVVALVVDYGIDAHVIDIPLHAGLITRIEQEVSFFWRSIESGHPPAADYSRDGAVIAALYPPEHDLPPIDLSTDNRLPDIVAEREELMARTRVDEKRKKEIDAEITEKLAGHSIGVLADGTKILRTMQERSYKARDAYTTSFPQIKIKRAAA